MQQSYFRSIFDADQSMWQLDDLQPALPLQQSGNLLMKCLDQWISVEMEIRPGRLYKKANQIMYCDLGRCRLKKFTFYESTMPLYKFGIRLSMRDQQEIFLMDSIERFKKLFLLLKRYCILERFKQKFKVINKAKFKDGLFGQCYFNCIHNNNYKLVRILEKQTLSQEQINFLIKEVNCLRQLNHPTVMFFNELYEDEEFICIVFNHYQGISMRSWFLENSCLPQEKHVAQIMYNLLQGVSHMHGNGIFHRNLQLETIYILGQLPQVMLMSFCYSEKYIPQSMYKKCGTPGFIAPEIFKSKSYTPKVDMFSLGVVFYTLCFGKMPFYSPKQEETLAKNQACIIDYDQGKSRKVSSSCLNLLKGLLIPEPDQRLSAAQALQHHWFIKMGTRQQQKQLQNPVKGRSLSTIIENSMDITHSIQFQPPSVIEDSVEKEFVADSLEVKLMKFNSLQLKPSKQRHYE